ncbi:MAG TPA: UDP-N-acetylmuramoyl-tripeptide--D-alanyl-D-alanine ligase, partial [Opitutaceae bacterium]|nr:UDP-N-acetylmuramoyl-tripeptide--D-alanyl-D-alanine ligase [Opitutaceae bacterium]
PASMSDAIEAFQSVASDDQPRLYIIGGMEELGPKAADYHHQLGKSLRLRADDYLFTIGSHADSVRDGLLANENRPDQVEVVTDLAPVAAKIAHFSGAVFVKGSRRYQLERILEAEVPVTSGAH